MPIFSGPSLEEINNPLLTTKERINAQREILRLYGGPTEEGRLKLAEDNSGPFRELERDSEFRQLVRSGDFEEVVRRLQDLKNRKMDKEAA
ncbi:MAG: hypothetical protein AAB617_01605 [Patescibacteria group bacterium]